MPKIPADQQQQGGVRDTVERLAGSLAVTTEPVFVCGVQRKVNIGNFETIDVYAGLALPLGAVVDEALREAVHQAAEVGFALTSEETAERYTFIKDLQRGSR